MIEHNGYQALPLLMQKIGASPPIFLLFPQSQPAFKNISFFDRRELSWSTKLE